MTAPKLVLSRLKISGFRGIPGEIELPLDARITLIYAPNGTGKTSICDAAEWLLSGRVDRLSTGTLEGEHSLRCKLAAPDTPTRVEASICLNGEKVDLVRNRAGLQRNETPIENAAWLREIALPDADARMAGNTAAVARATWIRGTRFLAGETLALLLDKGLDASRREQIFADLFGVRQMIDQERLVQEFANGIGSALDREKARLNDLRVRIEGITGELASRAANLSTDIFDAASLAIKRADGALAGLDVGELAPARGSTLKDQVSFLRAAVKYAQDRLSNRRRQLSFVSSGFSTFSNALAFRERLEADVASSEVTFERFSEELATLEAHREEANTTGHQTRISLDLWRRSVARVETRRSAAIASAERAALDADAIGAVDLLPEYRLTAEERAERRAALQSVIELAPDAELRDLEESRLPPPEDPVAEDKLVGLLSEIEQTEKEIEAEKASGATSRSASQELRIAALHFLDEHHDDSACPVCGHDWQHAEALRSAMERVKQSLATQETRARERIANLERKLTESRAKLASIRDREAKNRDVQKRRSALASERTRFQSLLARAGLSDSAGSYDAIARQALARLTAAEDLAMLLEELLLALDELNLRSGAPGGPLVRAEAFLKHARERIATLEGREAELAVEAQHTTTRIETARQNLSAAQRLLDQSRERLASHTQRVNEVETTWAELTRDTNLSEDALETERLRLEASASALEDAQEALLEADALLADVSLQGDLSRLKEAEAGLVKRVERLTDNYRLGQNTVEQFRAERRSQSTDQLAQLTRVFSPLFARVQANEVFDRLGGDPQHWKAYAGIQEFDPSEHFSQGQRQDFALALFIARARSLSGTFFLDEPMSHLDDLNRVALLDVMRMLALDAEHPLNLVLTTASEALVRQLGAKFSPIAAGSAEQPLLRAIELSGNTRSVVQTKPMFQM